MHHSLHGYAHGHRQLALSRPLSKSSQRTLLALSDMSGPSMLSGFETYLTGYPLGSDALFAFAKTWYAREMERPGCVWTHTLLFDYAIVGAISNLNDLIPHFRRPTKGEPLEVYERPLDIRDLSAARSERSLPSHDVVCHVLSTLYSEDRPVFLLVNDPASFEQLICTIWSQQWPRLRRSFSFCTGAIASRSVDRKVLDLQVIPVRNARDAIRQVPDCAVIDGDSESGMTPSVAWVELATKDLLSQHWLLLRDFLWQYGSKKNPKRSSFGQFARAFSSVQDYTSKTLSSEGLVSEIASIFSDPSEARRLKSALFGEASRQTLLIGLEESELLKVLALTPHQEAFDSDALELRPRAKRYWKHDPHRAKSLAHLVGEGTSGPLCEAINSGFAESIQVRELISLATEDPELLVAFVASNPTLATNAELWESPGNIQQLLARMLASNVPVTHKACNGIVHAQLAACTGFVAEIMATWLESALVGIVLDWLDSTDARDAHPLDPSWERVLGCRLQDVAAWLNAQDEIRSSTVAILTRFLSPRARELQAVDPHVWFRFARRARTELRPRELTDAMAFILVLGLESESATGPELARISFPIVYRAAKERNLSERSWKQLQRVMQRRRPFDQCQSLRNGLIERAAAFGWSTRSFLSCVEDTQILNALLGRWSMPHSEKTYIRRVIDEARKEPTIATAQQRRILAEYAARFSDYRA